MNRFVLTRQLFKEFSKSSQSSTINNNNTANNINISNFFKTTSQCSNNRSSSSYNRNNNNSFYRYFSTTSNGNESKSRGNYNDKNNNNNNKNHNNKNYKKYNNRKSSSYKKYKSLGVLFISPTFLVTSSSNQLITETSSSSSDKSHFSTTNTNNESESIENNNDNNNENNNETTTNENSNSSTTTTTTTTTTTLNEQIMEDVENDECSNDDDDISTTKNEDDNNNNNNFLEENNFNNSDDNNNENNDNNNNDNENNNNNEINNDGSISPRDTNNNKKLKDYHFYSGVCVIPHPNKRHKGGEDAYFISQDRKVLGVADGVGGWGDVGIDPSEYSNSLMQGSKIASNSSTINRDPLSIMEQGYIFSQDVKGSSTCCIIVLSSNTTTDHLLSANLGDSGFLIIRNSEVIFRTREQQHAFNMPFQLGTQSIDRPIHSVTSTLPVEEGDLIVLGTDGVFDNLFDSEILEIGEKSRGDPQQIARMIAKRAFEVGCSTTIETPFSRNANNNGYIYNGGKLDDITVIVGIVSEGPVKPVQPEVLLPDEDPNSI
eukprot:gene5511-6865_t